MFAKLLALFLCGARNICILVVDIGLFARYQAALSGLVRPFNCDGGGAAAMPVRHRLSYKPLSSAPASSLKGIILAVLFLVSDKVLIVLLLSEKPVLLQASSAIDSL